VYARRDFNLKTARAGASIKKSASENSLPPLTFADKAKILYLRPGDIGGLPIIPKTTTLMRLAMKIKALALASALLLSGPFAFAESVHLPQAIEHTKAAITHGEMGHAPILVEHAEAALTHAEASQKAEANPHTAEGITHLKASIDTGKKGDAAAGTTHAKEALKHLEMAEPAKKK
jgi:hypothetical protein